MLKRPLVDPAVFNEKHKDILAVLPAEAQPPNTPHGELSYTCKLTYDPAKSPLTLEVHMVKGFIRVVKPVMGAGCAQFGFSAFEGADKAWQAAIDAALLKANGNE